MQDGQRTQNTGTGDALGHWAPALLPGDDVANDPVVSTLSAARLAAEAAFAAPLVRSLPQPTTKVIVRRTRLPSLAAKRTPEANDGPTIQPTPKGSRVFRVEAAPTSRSAEASLAAVRPPTEASAHNSELPAQAPARPRARRIAADKRPGPVLHVIHASPEREREAEAPEPRLGALICELEKVTPILEKIARAQALSFVDERFESEWQRLSRTVDELHSQIRAQVC